LTKLIQKNARAAILVNQRQPLVIDDICLPEFLEVGQIFVKLHTSGICGSQLGEIDGVKGQDRYLPHLLGHEGCGEVLQVGPGVKHVMAGDLVVLHWRTGLGIQSDSPKYQWKGENLNAGWVTTFNSHSIVSENRCTKIPSDTDHELAALFGCAVTTGFGVIENNARLQIGESVVIFGAGGIGLNMIQAASLRSVYPIIAIDLIESRLNLAKEMGATHVINSKSSNIELKLKDILGDKLLDVFIDNTGIPKFIELGYKLTSKEGRVILVGVPNEEAKLNISSLPLHFGKYLSGSHGGECRPEKDIPRYLSYLKNKDSGLKSLVTSRFKLEDINKAIQSMRDGSTVGRVMIKL
tara:strand:+ start:2371 stop:3426 length:1056 start_codon:yes stop_codon:yes gene_type:complete